MGKRIALSNGRRLVDDVIRVATGLPMAGICRDLDLKELCELRKKVRPRISWNVIFMKAYSLVAREHSILRQAYVSFPWPYLFEHDQNVCLLTLSREYQGEERLLFARFGNPEEKSLIELNDRLEYLKKCDIEEVKQFRHQIAFAKCPSLFRRFVWWLLYYAFPKKRLNNMGTFGMSISGFQGTYGSKSLGPTTTILGIDHLPKSGISKLLYTFDHRVLDGKPAIDMVDELRKALVGPIADEFRDMIAMKESGNDNQQAA